MWRCKWVELQIKKLEGQARKYDRKLEGYSQKNLVEAERSSLEGRGIRQHTFSQNNCRSEILRRKKRRRAEETSDVAAYMSRHNLFSYYGTTLSSSLSGDIGLFFLLPILSLIRCIFTEHRKYIREISHNVLKNPGEKFIYIYFDHW